MQLGMIGLGRMGANMVRRLLRDGHECVVFDPVPAGRGVACSRAGDRRGLASRISSPNFARRASCG